MAGLTEHTKPQMKTSDPRVDPRVAPRWQRSLAAVLAAGLALSLAPPTRGQAGPAVTPIDPADFSTDVRPQDDFYAYVNGGWLERVEIPEDQRGVGMLQTMTSQARQRSRDLVEELVARVDHPKGTSAQFVADYFRSFMDSDRVEELGTQPLAELLEAVAAAPTKEDLLVLGMGLGREGVPALLRVHVDKDFADSSRYVATLWPWGLTLQGSSAYLGEEPGMRALREGLPDYVEMLLASAGVDAADLEARAEAVVRLETELARIQQPAEGLRDIGGYNPFPVHELEGLDARLPWTRLLAAASLAGVETVVVRSPSYVRELGRLFVELPLDAWRDYWVVRVLDAHADLLPERFVQARFTAVDGPSQGLSALPPRSERAIRRVSSDLDWPLARLYAERYFTAEARAALDEMIDDLVAAFGDAIDGNEWMSAATRVRAREKLARVTRRIGHPTVWPESPGLRIVADDLVGNARRAAAARHDRQVSYLSTPPDPGQDFSVPMWVTATYDVTSNAIEFTVPILQPPLFMVDAEPAYNYATIGGVIGHELGHGFDDEGRRFDGDGNLADWWTGEDARRYAERADRLAAWFSGIEPLPGLHVDGRRTLGENIADLTGVTIALAAYRASLDGREAPVIHGLTGDQRFFVSYALAWRNKLREEALRQWILFRPMSPPKVRVNGPLSHLDAFHRAFGVEPGDGMWLAPEDRVRIW